MKILRFMQSVPAGTLNVPMAVTAIINTLWPQSLQIGGATTALFANGTMTLIGVMLFLTGSQFMVSQVAATVRRGFVLICAKLAIGFVGAALVLHILPPSGIWGVSTIALVAALTATNPGIYLAICNKHGDAVDRAAFGPLNLISVPAIAILFMGLGDGGSFSAVTLVQVAIPFAAGMLVGNLDPDVSAFLRPGTVVILPFLGFCFGSVIDLRLLVTAGGSGLLLTLFYILANVPFLLLVDRLVLRRPGHAALGVSSAAGISITVPGIYAATHPAFAPYAEVAAAQIAMIVVVTSFLMPILADRVKDRGAATEPAAP